MKLFQFLSLKSRILMIVSFVCIICSATAMSLALYFNKQELYKGVIDKSNAIHLRLDAVKDFVSTQGTLESISPTISSSKNARYLQNVKDNSQELKHLSTISSHNFRDVPPLIKDTINLRHGHCNF